MVKRVLPALGTVATLAVAGVIAFAVYDWFWRAPQAKATLPELRAELEKIPLPTDAHDVTHWESWKGGSALVGVGFVSDLPWSDVEHHYDLQLQRLGWTPHAIKSVKIWGQDFGGKSQNFRKGRLTASLYYRGSDTNTPPYTVDISWGLH